MWEVVTEKKVKKYSDGSVYHYEFPGIRRTSDGFTLIGGGIGREKQQDFLCKGNFGEFWFYATRWNYENDTPSEKYIVHTQLTPHHESVDKSENRKLILEHAKDIESALLHFIPKQNIFGHTSAKEVWFDLNLPSDGRELVKAQEI